MGYIKVTLYIWDISKLLCKGTLLNIGHTGNLISYGINTAQKMKFTIKVFSSKCDQIRRKLQIWSHLLEKSSMKNFIFCAVKRVLAAAQCLHDWDKLTYNRDKIKVL